MAENERCEEPRFTHVWLSRNKKSTWNVLSLCAVITSDRMLVPHRELLPTLATRLPLQVTFLPMSGLINPVAHIQNTPQRPPLPLLSRYFWSVTIFKHLFNRYSKTQISLSTQGKCFQNQ